ncbi:MAG: hypothetical protein AMJ64_10130 [Betaproteobacteria bacterium SG8_39]|nr:MAG: hypothetical protein AMJ64_10130 [Betaproteobacteria bacterium SG8_39]
MSQQIAFEVSLSVPYEQAIEKTAEALKAEGFGILTRIDVKQTLKEKINAEFRPYAILGACNPPLAHKALSHDGQVGLMLPCNVTVEAKDDRHSIVRIGDPDAFLKIGEFAKDAVLQGVAKEARARLARAADALKRA